MIRMYRLFDVTRKFDIIRAFMNERTESIWGKKEGCAWSILSSVQQGILIMARQP